MSVVEALMEQCLPAVRTQARLFPVIRTSEEEQEAAREAYSGELNLYS